MNNTTITLTNLPPVIAQLFGDATAVDLDLPGDFSIRLTKNVEQLSILNKISTEAALGFSVPFTPTNDRLFTEYATPLTLGTPSLYYSVRVIVNGSPLQFSRLYVRGKNEPNREWELELVRDPNHWVELASQVRTNDLDFGTFQMTKANIVDSWANNTYNGDPATLTGGSPVYWWLVRSNRTAATSAEQPCSRRRRRRFPPVVVVPVYLASRVLRVRLDNSIRFV
jgi:hypothetical protein